MIEDHSQLNYSIEFSSEQHGCGFAQILSKLQIHFIQTQGVIVRTKGSGAQSPSTGRWLSRLFKNQATEQLTDIGTGSFRLDYQKALIMR